MEDIRRKILNGEIKTSDLKNDELNNLIDDIFYNEFNADKKALLKIFYGNFPFRILEIYSIPLGEIGENFVLFDVILSNMNINKNNILKNKELITKILIKDFNNFLDCKEYITVIDFLKENHKDKNNFFIKLIVEILAKSTKENSNLKCFENTIILNELYEFGYKFINSNNELLSIINDLSTRKIKIKDYNKCSKMVKFSKEHIFLDNKNSSNSFLLFYNVINSNISKIIDYDPKNLGFYDVCLHLEDNGEEISGIVKRKKYYLMVFHALLRANLLSGFNVDRGLFNVLPEIKRYGHVNESFWDIDLESNYNKVIESILNKDIYSSVFGISIFMEMYTRKILIKKGVADIKIPENNKYKKIHRALLNELINEAYSYEVLNKDEKNVFKYFLCNSEDLGIDFRNKLVHGLLSVKDIENEFSIEAWNLIVYFIGFVLSRVNAKDNNKKSIDFCNFIFSAVDDDISKKEKLMTRNSNSSN